MNRRLCVASLVIALGSVATAATAGTPPKVDLQQGGCSAATASGLEIFCVTSSAAGGADTSVKATVFKIPPNVAGGKAEGEELYSDLFGNVAFAQDNEEAKRDLTKETDKVESTLRDRGFDTAALVELKAQGSKYASPDGAFVLTVTGSKKNVVAKAGAKGAKTTRDIKVAMEQGDPEFGKVYWLAGSSLFAVLVSDMSPVSADEDDMRSIGDEKLVFVRPPEPAAAGKPAPEKEAEGGKGKPAPEKKEAAAPKTK